MSARGAHRTIPISRGCDTRPRPLNTWIARWRRYLNVLKGRNRAGDRLAVMSNVAALVPREATATRPIAISSFAISSISHVSMIVTWPRVILPSFLFFPFFFSECDSIAISRDDSRRKRATFVAEVRAHFVFPVLGVHAVRLPVALWGSPHCVQRGRGSRERGSRESSLVPTATATTTCRLPPGFHEMDPPAWPRRMRLDTTENRAVAGWGRNCAFFTHFSVTPTNFPDSRSEF